jgi:hypothetical protein
MPARNNVNTNWTLAGGAANTAASRGKDGTSMCSAAGAIAVTMISRPSGDRRLMTFTAATDTEIGSERHRATDDAAVKHATISADLVIGDSAVKEAAVVPNHQIALAPAVRINEFWPGRVLQ